MDSVPIFLVYELFVIIYAFLYFGFWLFIGLIGWLVDIFAVLGIEPRA